MVRELRARVPDPETSHEVHALVVEQAVRQHLLFCCSPCPALPRFGPADIWSVQTSVQRGYKDIRGGVKAA